MTRTRVTWGWASVADFLFSMVGIGTAIWRIATTGTIDPAVGGFIAWCLGVPLVRRGVESRVGK